MKFVKYILCLSVCFCFATVALAQKKEGKDSGKKDTTKPADNKVDPKKDDKKGDPKKEDPKKTDPKKDDKKGDPKKEDPKKNDPKKDDKKGDPKKEDPKKTDTKDEKKSDVKKGDDKAKKDDKTKSKAEVTPPPAPPPVIAPPPKLTGMNAKNAFSVVIVNDGDALTVVDMDNQKKKIRLRGIDAPEFNQPYGPEAKEFLRTLCQGKMVNVVEDSLKIPGENSVIADIILQDGKNVSQEMLKAGMAWYQKNQFQDPKLQELEQQALTEKRGLWAGAKVVAPWDWKW